MSIQYPRELRTIGDHIRFKRLERKLFQSQVAKLLNVSTESITSWELGHREPRINVLPRIIEFLGYVPFNKPNEVLSEKCLYYRKVNGKTRLQFAKQLGIDEQTLKKVELGLKTLNGEPVIILQQLLFNNDLPIT